MLPKRDVLSGWGRKTGKDGSDGYRQCSHCVSAAGKGASPRTSGDHGPRRCMTPQDRIISERTGSVGRDRLLY